MFTLPTFSSGVWHIAGLANTRVFSAVSEAQFAAGYSQRSGWGTWQPKQFVRNLRVMSAADVVLFEAFMDNIDQGADYFAWYDQHSTNYYYVRLDLRSLPITFALDGHPDRYRTEKPLIFNQYDDTETSQGEFGFGPFGAGVFGE